MKRPLIDLVTFQLGFMINLINPKELRNLRDILKLFEFINVGWFAKPNSVKVQKLALKRRL